jgi:hypothetical protein
MANKRNAKKRVAKATPRKIQRKRKTIENPFPSKLDVHFIQAKEIFDSAKRAGWSNEYALAFAMEPDSHPNWVIDPSDPIRKIGWEDGEEDI